MPSTLDGRALNRATLERQLLLRRAALPVADALERLAGLQAQVPVVPYQALWSRLDPFDPHALGALIADRHAVRTWLMRSTIHLVTDADALALRPLMQPVLHRTWKGSTFSKAVAHIDLDELLASGRALVEDRARPRAEIGRELAGRWPGTDLESLGATIGFLVPLVQVPPRGVWGARGRATLTTIESWLGRPLNAAPSPERLVERYLAALGPASAMDMQNWCGLSRLGEVFDRMRDRLVTFRDPDGRELFDLPDAPRPDPDTPASPRLLPEYDNVLLGHADRSRFRRPGEHAPVFGDGVLGVGMVLVDGVVTGAWRIARDGGAATLTVGFYAPVADAEAQAVLDEAEGMLAFSAPDARERRVRLK